MRSTIDLDRYASGRPGPVDLWMARHAVPGGLITALALGVGAGFAFALTSWVLGAVLGLVYSSIGVLLWADAVRKVVRWRRKRRAAADVLGGRLSALAPDVRVTG